MSRKIERRNGNKAGFYSKAYLQQLLHGTWEIEGVWVGGLFNRGLKQLPPPWVCVCVEKPVLLTLKFGGGAHVWGEQSKPPYRRKNFWLEMFFFKYSLTHALSSLTPIFLGSLIGQSLSWLNILNFKVTQNSGWKKHS